MRMWKNTPDQLCRVHLIGEHGEIHKFKHNFEKKHNMVNRMKLNQINPKVMKKRHDELVKEMLRRGYIHQSPYELPDISYLPDILIELETSFDKCEECLKLKKGGE